jgi:signal transduction histidine kinase
MVKLQFKIVFSIILCIVLVSSASVLQDLANANIDKDLETALKVRQAASDLMFYTCDSFSIMKSYAISTHRVELEQLRKQLIDSIYLANLNIGVLQNEDVEPYSLAILKEYFDRGINASQELTYYHDFKLNEKDESKIQELEKKEKLSLAVIEDSQQKISGAVDRIISKTLEAYDSNLAKKSRIRATIQIYFLIILLVAVIFSLYAARSVYKPITSLLKGTEEIRNGNLDITLPIETKDEIGMLTDSFNHMSKELKNERQELKKSNENLEETNLKLQKLDTQKDEFISLVAHELKTPLTSIRGFSQVLQDPSILSDTDKSRHYLELIDKNTDQLYTLVLDIVDSSRISLGKLSLNIDEVDTYRVLDNIRENMALVISGKNLTPVFSFEAGLPRIMADYERTLQIIRNLISNSIKFTEKGSISLEAHREGQFVQFSVADTGQGIPEENQKLIFSRFYQVDSTLTRKAGGSGLGLSICYGLVRNMGGKIWFKSVPNSGTTFFFTIPVSGGNS